MLGKYYSNIVIHFKLFMKQTHKSAFTLIELLTVIAITTIIALWVSRLNFNTISDKQNLDRHVTKVVAYFETIRNNALLWKWIWTTLQHPEYYKIDFSNIWWWKIISHSHSWWTNTILSSPTSPVFSGWTVNTLSWLRCLQLDWSEDQTIISWTGSIQITGANMLLTWECTSDSSKILELEIARKGYTKKIHINTLNGLISIID